MIVVTINNYEPMQAADLAAADIEYDLRQAGWDVTVTLEGHDTYIPSGPRSPA